MKVVKIKYIFFAFCIIFFLSCVERKNDNNNVVNAREGNINQGGKKMEIAIFAAGCFWGIEAAFQVLKGVVSTEVGYTGGHKKNPTYEQVCTGKTGHAEAVKVIYDSKKISYAELLKVFWKIHDPTTLNRQGPDVGSQYRSAIFYLNDKQREIAVKSKKDLQNSGRYNKPIVTEVTQAGEFYRAEEYHQKYLQKRGRLTCGA